MPAELRGIPEVWLTDYPTGLTPGQAKQDQQLIMQIRQENNVKQDGFLLAQMDRRRELRGLPFIMGDDCKLTNERGNEFQQSVLAVRNAMDANRTRPFVANIHSYAGIAAYSQILGPENADVRTTFTQQLASSQMPPPRKNWRRRRSLTATGTCASPPSRRCKAEREYTDVLLQGMRYPMPAVARRTAQAIIVLNRTDLLPQLAEMLGEAARYPRGADGRRGGRRGPRSGAHQSSPQLLALPRPGDDGAIVRGARLDADSGLPFPTTLCEYYGERLVQNEPAVRADTTYLRQDFWVMLPVADATPWPEKQRFDFLVRTRVVEGAELAKLQAEIAARPAGQLSKPESRHRLALRELTGQNADPTRKPGAMCWRRIDDPRNGPP